MGAVRMTVHTQLVLRALLADPECELYGMEIKMRTNLFPGSTYPILQRLERVGWISARWEQVDPQVEKRPRRRYYRLTPDGAVHARAALCAAGRTNPNFFLMASPAGTRLP